MSLLQQIRSTMTEMREDADEREDFELGPTKFVIGLLSREEEVFAYEKAQEYSDSAHVVNSLVSDVIRMSYAIRMLNDIEIPVSIEDPDTKKKIKRQALLEGELMSMPSTLIEALVVKYNTANARLRDRLGLTTFTVEDFVTNLTSLEDELEGTEEETAEES